MDPQYLFNARCFRYSNFCGIFICRCLSRIFLHFQDFVDLFFFYTSNANVEKIEKKENVKSVKKMSKNFRKAKAKIISSQKT